MKNTQTLFLLLIFTGLSTLAFAKTEKIFFTPEDAEANYVTSNYAYILNLWGGPEEASKEQSDSEKSGRKFRITALKLPGSKCQDVILDEFRVESTGISSHVKSSTLNLSKCIETFRLKKWLSPTSSEFEMNKKSYVIEDLGNQNVGIYRR